MVPSDGIVCLDKPQDITSFACCSIFRRLLHTKKIGHAGTLDPMATGVLPLLIGNATRALDLLPVHDKRYTAALRFGYVSNTQDIWGSVAATGGTLPSLQSVEEKLPAFRGNILQIPPMVSAIKKDGVHLYDLARRGIEIEREARPVTIYKLELLEYNALAGELTFDCMCSKGTYIRTICTDLGDALGCGAVMTSLRRTMAAGFSLDQCITLEEARGLAADEKLEDRLLPVESVFEGYEQVTVSPAQAVRFANGGALSLDRLPVRVAGIARVHAPDGCFLGLGKPENGELAILKLFPAST